MHYLYDDSLEGLFTIIYDNYSHIEKAGISVDANQIDFLEKIYIKTDLTKAKKVKAAINKNLGPRFLLAIEKVFKSNDINRERIIAICLKYSLLKGKDFINSENKYARLFMINLKNYSREVHKFKGFLRFSKLENGYLFARYESRNYILEDLGKFFLKRLPQENFAIYDIKRKIIFVSAKGDLSLFEVSSLDIKESESDKKIKDLWLGFFESVAIKQRVNKLRAQSNMPKKYRKYMPEKNHLPD